MTLKRTYYVLMFLAVFSIFAVVIELAQTVLIAVLLVTHLPSSDYEYQIIAPEDALLESSLNLLGLDGWEVVSARRAMGDEKASYELIMKRNRNY